jgi:hypothetical protein
MHHRKLLAGLAVGSLAALGGFGFGGPPEDAGPPDGMPDEAQNGCNGIERAQETPAGDGPAGDVLDAVEDLLTNGEGCGSNGDS